MMDNGGTTIEVESQVNESEVQIAVCPAGSDVVEIQEDTVEDEGVQHGLCCGKIPFRRYGNMFILLGKPTGQFPSSCLVGPDWYCMLCTYALVCIPTILCLVFVGWKVHWVVEILIACALVSTLVCFSMIACSDPGIVYKNYMPATAATAPGIITCAQCHVRRPFGAMHCYECGCCISGLDHHCPWTGKCIGRKTIHWFYAFLWSLMTLLIVVAGACVYHFMNDSGM